MNEKTEEEKIAEIKSDPLLMELLGIHNVFNKTMGSLLDIILRLEKDVEILKKEKENGNK